MPFILQDVQNGNWRPLDDALFVRALQCRKFLCNLSARVSMKIHEKTQAHRLRLLLVDDKIAVFVSVITQKRWRQVDSALETHIDRPIHAVAFDAGFLLRYCGQDRQGQLIVVVQTVHVLHFKEDIHGRGQ